jgi:hypothetical protein
MRVLAATRRPDERAPLLADADRRGDRPHGAEPLMRHLHDALAGEGLGIGQGLQDVVDRGAREELAKSGVFGEPPADGASPALQMAPAEKG